VNRALSGAGTLAVATAVAVLATGCVVHVHIDTSGGPASTGSATYQEELAYAQCMRAHGLANFPDPNPSGRSSFSVRLTGNPGSPAARANAACKHLLPSGSAATSGYQAAPGWDSVTGWESPDAGVLVPLLARYASP
jgi:hypothetical protein